jgi:DNA-binding PadR family transcriptional regulator
VSLLEEESLGDIVGEFERFYILLILFEDPSHGYGILCKYRHRAGRQLSAGTLYPFLQTLEKQGIVSSVDKPVGKRPHREYSLTTKGRRAAEQLFSRFASITAAAFESNLEVCASCGCRVHGAHYEEVQGKKLAFCCCHCAAAYRRERAMASEQERLLPRTYGGVD